MTISNLTLLSAIAENSDATPGLWNSAYSILNADLAAIASNASTNLFADGSVVQPSIAFSSESSLGFYRSGASQIAQSYGTFTAPNFAGSLYSSTAVGGQIDLLLTPNNAIRVGPAGPDYFFDIGNMRVRDGDGTTANNGTIAGNGGVATKPTFRFNSELSLGLYNSATSTIAQSYGTFSASILSCNTLTYAVLNPAVSVNPSVISRNMQQVNSPAGSPVTLSVITIPANSLVLNGEVQLNAVGHGVNNANAKTLFVIVGGMNQCASSIAMPSSQSANWELNFRLGCRDTSNSSNTCPFDFRMWTSGVGGSNIVLAQSSINGGIFNAGSGPFKCNPTVDIPISIQVGQTSAADIALDGWTLTKIT